MDEFSALVLEFLDLTLKSDQILKYKDSISRSRENTDAPWCNLTIGIFKVSPLDTLNQPRAEGKGLSICIYDHLNHFLKKTSKCNEIGWMFLMSLNKAEKEKDEPWDLNFQLHHQKNALKAFMCVLKQTPISLN